MLRLWLYFYSVIDITVLVNRLHLVPGYEVTTQDNEDIKKLLWAGGCGCVMWAGNIMEEQGDVRI